MEYNKELDFIQKKFEQNLFEIGPKFFNLS